MCVNPLYIKNRRLDFHPYIDKSNFYVNCGKCYACQKKKAQDYETRCICESIYGYKNVYFFTLTYDNKHLPIVEIKDSYFPCFDVSVLQKFFKRLRKSLGSLKFKYFLTSEYGGLRGRPHHHLLLFFQNSCLDIKKHVHDCWQQGFVYPKLRSTDDGKINSIDAIGYTCKYVCKGSDIPFIPYDVLESYGDLFTPPHLQSVGLGLNLKDHLIDVNYVKGSFHLTTDKGTKSYPIPFYIIRKVLYNTELNENGNIRYTINDFGISVKEKGCFRIVNDTFDKLKYIHSHIHDFNLPLHERFSISSLTDSDILFLAKYKLFYVGTENLSLPHDYRTAIHDYFSHSVSRAIHFNTYSPNQSINVIRAKYLCSIFTKCLQSLQYSDDYQKYLENLQFKKFYYGKKYKKEIQNFPKFHDYLYGKRIYV